LEINRGETGEATEKEMIAKKPKDDNMRLSEVLEDKTSGVINKKLFRGFSFINYFVKRG
jgi:hypothetical protein